MKHKTGQLEDFVIFGKKSIPRWWIILQVNNLRMRSSDYGCKGCGFKLKDVSDFWLKTCNRNVICPCCRRGDAWVKLTLMNKKEFETSLPDPELWKKLLIVNNQSMFHRGKFELSRNAREAMHYMDELKRSKNKKERHKGDILEDTMKMGVKRGVLD
jgi:hypothetical protein